MYLCCHFFKSEDCFKLFSACCLQISEKRFCRMALSLCIALAYLCKMLCYENVGYYLQMFSLVFSGIIFIFSSFNPCTCDKTVSWQWLLFFYEGQFVYSYITVLEGKYKTYILCPDVMIRA